MNLSLVTVDGHWCRLTRKLGVKSVTRRIRGKAIMVPIQGRTDLKSTVLLIRLPILYRHYVKQTTKTYCRENTST